MRSRFFLTPSIVFIGLGIGVDYQSQLECPSCPTCLLIQELEVNKVKAAIVSFVAIVCLCSTVLAQRPGVRPDPPVGSGTVVLRAARLIDGNGGTPITNAAVVIVDNKITEVGPASQVRVPANARTIDLGD